MQVTFSKRSRGQENDLVVEHERFCLLCKFLFIFIFKLQVYLSCAVREARQEFVFVRWEGIQHLMESRGISDFLIKLDSPQPVFYPGQTINGLVSLETDAPINIQSVSVKLVGKTYSHWKESCGVGKNQRKMVDYSGKDVFTKSSTCLFDAKDAELGAKTYKLPAGDHEFQFSFTLEDDLPSSFEGELGYIRYLIKAKLMRQGRDDMVKYALTINDLINTNDAKYSDGDGGQTHKEHSCFCYNLGYFDMNATINRCCYCPGESIIINVDAENSTSTDMESLEATLMQATTYHTKGNKKTTTKDIAKLQGPLLLKKSRVTWQDQALGIPATQPSIHTKLISVRYTLVITVDVPMGDKSSIIIPITMGTIPYVPTYGQKVKYGTPDDPQGAPRANFINELTCPPPRPADFGYPDMHPPSYSAAVGERRVYIGKDKDFNTFGDLHYIPVYTFSRLYKGPYNFSDDEPNASQVIPVQPAPEIS